MRQENKTKRYEDGVGHVQPTQSKLLVLKMNSSTRTTKCICKWKWFPIYCAPAISQALVWVSCMISDPQRNTLPSSAENRRAGRRQHVLPKGAKTPPRQGVLNLHVLEEGRV